MKAIYFEQTGEAAEVLIYGEKETPQVSAGEVLVRLKASAINPSDVKKRGGYQAPGFVDGFVIPHSDGAGVVEAVGEGVSEERVGERVWVCQAQFQRHLGTAAEYVALPSEHACGLPEQTSFEIGACAGIPMMTAHRSVHLGGGVEGQTVLVTGTSGRVGFYAAQFAKLTGATVIGTAGSAERLKIVEDSGVDLSLNYKQDNVVEAVMDFTDGAGVDRIIDVEFGVNVNQSVEMLKVNGVIATYSSSQMPEPTIPFYPLMFKNIALRMVLVYNIPDKAKQKAMTGITDALENQSLKHRIAKTYSLVDTAKAHQAIEQGGLDGCVVVQV